MISRRMLQEIGHTFSAADVDETIVARPANGRLALATVVAFAPSGVTAPTVTLKDGATVIGRWSLAVGDTKTLLSFPQGLTFSDRLVAQASATTVVVSAWAMEVA